MPSEPRVLKLDSSILAVCVLLVSASTPGHAQVAVTDTIHGTVVAESGLPLAGAEIIATRAPDRAGFRAVTDSNGFYRIVVADGTGDYLVHVASQGYETFRKRFVRPRNTTALVIDVTLKSAVQQLAPVSVAAKKLKPTRDPAFGAEVGSAEKIADGITAAIPPDAAGDLATIAAAIPGVTPQADGGFSVLGLGSQQNAVTLDGMAFSGTSLPRDARTRTRVSTSAMDPARGWFSGGQINVELASGGLFSSRHMDVTADAPVLQYTDATSARLGSRYSNLQASIGGEGPFTESDTYFYSYGIEGSHRSSNPASLLDADPEVLARAGVAGDSVAKAVAALSRLGVPLTAQGVASRQTSDHLSMVARFDHAPYNWTTFSPAKSTWGLTTFGNVLHAGALRVGPTVAPSATGTQADWDLGGQAFYSTYFGDDWLNDTRSAYSISDNQTAPYVRLPGGRVLIASDLPDETGGLTTLQFGGNGGLDAHTRQWTWETTNETQFYHTGRSVHRIKVNLDSRLDGYTQESPTDMYGTFSYNSLADLEAGNPSSFSRDLNRTPTSGGEWNGFASVGDIWRASSALQVAYGLRLEGNRFTSSPSYDPAIATEFGVRNDHAPNAIGISPRLGFTWARTGGGIRFTPLGTFNLGPTSYVRGGIGEFRNMLPPTLLSNAAASTGLVGADRRVLCAGAAVPSPNWADYISSAGNIPTQCTGGLPSLSSAGSAVQLFDSHYTAPQSWRTNLAYSSSYRSLAYTIEGIYSLNRNQSGWEDLNFAGSPAFKLPSEGDRPIFAETSGIDPATGAVSSASSRRSTAFGSLVNNQSVNRSRSSQVTVTMSPDLSDVSNWLLSGSYTLSSTRELTNGFDRTTFDSPQLREWERGPLDIRHQLLVQAGYSTHGLTLTTFGRFMSGAPFTPVVGTDINGDGLPNDRAFVFDPARAAGTTLASDLGSLLSAGGTARDCLGHQVGSVARPNSCEGPWTASLNLQVNATSELLHTGRMTNVSLFLSNPLGGVDQLLHGTSHLHGWGAPALPDPVLYNVRGFDAASRQFSYVVNPRFASTRPANTIFRVPFRVTLDVSIDLSKPLPEQQLDRSLRAGRNGHPGPRLTVSQMKQRYARLVRDPYLSILTESDSLLLTRDQADSLQQIDGRYRQKVDSTWFELATYLDRLGDNYDAATALRRQEAAIDDVWEITRVDVQDSLRRILTPIQLKLLPPAAAFFYKMKERTHAPRNTF